MNLSSLERFIDGFILFCLCVLVIFLPIAHTETIRAFALGIPGGLWIIKMILSRRLLFSRTPLDLPLLLFTIVAALSVITAVDWRYSLEELVGDWIIGLFLFYLVVNNVRSEQMKYILGALLFGNIIMVSYGIYDFFRQGGQLLDYKVRAGSLHSGFSTFAIYLLTAIPYLLTAFFSARRAANRLILMALFLLNLFAIYLTQSRGAWVATGVLVFFAGWRFLPKKLFLLLGLAAMIIFFFAPQKIMRHYTGNTTPGAPNSTIETAQARWEVTKFSLERLWESPFQMLGYGRRSFVKKYENFHRKYEEQYPGSQLWHAHNTFLDTALETGIQGLIFFVFLLYRLLKFTYVSAESENRLLLKFYFSATFLMVISFFSGNLFDDCFIDDSALLFWFLSGMAIAFDRKYECAGS